MNLILSVDDRLIERAREVARQQGTSLNTLIRDYLEGLVGQIGGDEILSEFEAMWPSPATLKENPSDAKNSMRSA